MIELLSTETKPVYIGYNKLAADVAEATTDALTGADYIALQAAIKYLWFMVILLAVVALLALVLPALPSLRYRFIHLCTGGQTQPVQGHGEAHG